MLILYPGATLQVIGYCLEAPAPPFAVLCLGYAINGIGMSLLVSRCLDVLLTGLNG